MFEIGEEDLIQGQICFVAAMSQILRNVQINISEEVLYGLGYGLNFRYKVQPDHGYLDMDCADLITDYDTYISFFHTLGIHIDLYEIYGAEEFKRALVNASGVSVLAAVDSFYTPYSNTFHQRHDIHVVVLTYIGNDKVLLQDNYVSAVVPQKKFATVSISDVEKWCIVNGLSGEQPKYIIWKFDISNYSNNLSLESIRKRILFLDERLQNMSSLDNTTYGTDAFQNLLKTFETYRENDFCEPEVLIKINERLSANGGLYQTRRLYGQFIRWYGNWIKDEVARNRINDTVAQFENIADKWRILSTMILKASILKRVPKWQNIIERCNENIIAEKQCYSDFIQQYVCHDSSCTEKG